MAKVWITGGGVCIPNFVIQLTVTIYGKKFGLYGRADLSGNFTFIATSTAGAQPVVLYITLTPQERQRGGVCGVEYKYGK